MQARHGACFCCHGIRFTACRPNRGTGFMGGRVIVPVQNVLSMQLRVSGCNFQGESQWPAGYNADKRLKVRRNFGPIEHLRF